MRLTASLILLLLSADGGTPPPLPEGAVELLPAGTAPDAKLPVVIAIHGRGGNPERFGKLVQNCAAGARIVGLRAPDRWGEGFSWLEMPIASAGDSPESDRAFTALLQKRVVEIRAAIAQIVKARPHCGDPILVGFSQGGALVLALAASAPADFKAQYLEIAGALPASFPLGPNLPDLIGFQGTADQSVPYAEATATFQRVPKSVTWTLYAYEGAGHDPPRELRKDLGDELRQAYQRACPKP
ncbi:MAG TPA: alpha/beta fold hydrolase [Myxococcaceae bacterium]|nr:alpha/beta fold hydrolase [Myxococcaceae bacterium]